MRNLTKAAVFALVLVTPVALAQTDATSSASTTGTTVVTTRDNTGLWGLLGLLGLAGLAGLRRPPAGLVSADHTGNANVRR